MPRSIQELQKRVFQLEKQNRCQAVKIWHLEEEKEDLVREVERLVGRKEAGLGEAESNKGKRVSFGGIHFGNNTTGMEEGGNINVSVDSVEEIEITLQEREIPGFEFCSKSGQHPDGNEEIGEAFCTGARSPSDEAGVSPARQGPEEFITEGSGENEFLVRGGFSEDGADLLVGEKVASSSLETEEGEGGLEISEKEDFTTAGAEQGLVAKEKQEKNLGKGLMVEPLPSKSKWEVVSIGGESDLEKSDRLGRVLRGSVGSAGKEAANKALRKQGGVEERFPLKKRRLASQGKLKEGDRLKVARGGRFYSCKVVTVRLSALKVHYMGWGAEFDEWVPFPSKTVELDI